jgi:two-component system, chemotaxis family, chemotaxis protein CheY
MSGSYDNLKALIVEDNVHMRVLLRSLLQALGIRNIHESGDGESGFAELCARNPDIVLTDLSMAPTDGIHLTKQIRTGGNSPNRYVPIIMVTGHTEKARVEAARDAGVTEFLAKPITVQNLMSRLAEIVERPRPFVKCDNYFGPERRRRRIEGYSGPWRRKDDLKDDLEIR